MIQIHSEAAEATVTRLTWREQARALPASLRATVRRLLRREPRWYYVVEGRVVARLTSVEDQQIMLDWIGQMHSETFYHGVNFGGVLNAANGDEAHAGDPGPS